MHNDIRTKNKRTKVRIVVYDSVGSIDCVHEVSRVIYDKDKDQVVRFDNSFHWITGRNPNGMPLVNVRN